MLPLGSSTLSLRHLPVLPLALGALLAAAGSPLGSPAGGQARAEEPAVGIEELCRLDLLPRFKGSVRVASVSSYDRTGGNDDGFSGKYSAVRKEPEGIVIADLEGPGCVYRIWTPTPTDDVVEFLFDGEAAPRISAKFREMFLGKTEPFLAPLVGYGAGGFYSYVPLPFAKSLKIRVRAERVQFYQVNYAVYPPAAAGTQIRTFDPQPSADDLERREKARKLLSSAGADISPWVVPPGTPLEVVRSRMSLEPGKTSTLYSADHGGRIAGIRLTPAAALGGKGRDILLRVTLDGDAAVDCPAGDFFGYAWGRPATTSLLVGTKGDVSYCYFPMPFERSAKVEVVSERASGAPVEIRAEVVTSALARGPEEGRFHALWRRESPTATGQPFTFLRAEGRGHLVGCILQEQGLESGKTLFFEGDDQTTIDGELVIHGTGSEDFFNGGWYDVPGRWERRLSFPLSGCLAYEKHLGRTGAYRIFIGDAYPFRKGILQTIEHGGTGNDIPTDACAVTFFYLDRKADVAPPPVEARRVVDPRRIIFATWWQIPIRAFPFQNATLEKRGEKIGGEDVRFLSLRAQGPDWFGEPFIAVECDVPAAGRYAVSIDAVKGPGQAIVRMFENEAPAGDPVDLWAEAREKSGFARLGVLEMEEGANTVLLKLVGKNEKATGLGLDLVHVALERTE